MSEKTPIKVIYDDPPQSTRDQIIQFSRAFKRPVNDRVVALTVTERELLGNLIFEECVEYLTKGLGLKITIEQSSRCELADDISKYLSVELNEGQPYDPIESADGLGDMNVVIHFNALWHGFNLDDVTREIHESNMSKLGEDGEPIINECKHYGGDKQPGFLVGYNPNVPEPVDFQLCHNRVRTNTCDDPAHLIDPTRPAGKILKGPNFRKPDIAKVIFGKVAPAFLSGAAD